MKNTIVLFICSVLITSVGIIGVAIFLAPPQINLLFIQRVVWTLILNLLFQCNSWKWIDKQDDFVDTAVIALKSHWTQTYCLTSFLLMLGSIYLDSEYRKYYLSIQVILFVIYMYYTLHIYLATVFAKKDLMISKNVAISPIDLANNLIILEKKVEDARNKKLLKQLHEKLTYSLPDTNKIRTAESYKQLVIQIQNLENTPAEHLTSNIEACLSNLKQFINKIGR